jgi:N-acetylneuraminic acid mutarotase
MLKKSNFQGKFWVFGGSTGDDSYDHTITDKVQAYQPRDQQWSVETPLTSPRHKACAVTIDDSVVITGGTMLGLGKVRTINSISFKILTLRLNFL